METNKIYIPTHAVHPYEILKDELSARGISQKEFAGRIGMLPSNFNRMLKSKGDLSFSLAIQLESELDIPAEHWMRFMKSYIRDKDLIATRNEIEAKAKAEEAAFNERISVKEFYKHLGLVYKSIEEKVSALKRYEELIFNSKVAFSGGAFKKSKLCNTDAYNLLTWIVIATAMADEVSAGMEYRNGYAEGAALEISKLANGGELTIANVKTVLNKYGIGYAHLEKLDKTPVDAYSTIRNGVPVIIATYRINDRDKFAFDILHELGHISLHIESGLKQNFINIDGEYENLAYERQADNYAKDHLIPPKEWKDIMSITTRTLYPEHLCQLIGDKAKIKGISPSIAVSRYKHESKMYNVMAYRSAKLH